MFTITATKNMKRRLGEAPAGPHSKVRRIMSSLPDRMLHKTLQGQEEEPKPDAVVASILGHAVHHPPFDSLQDFFRAPTKEEIDGYQFDILAAVRASDVTTLRKFYQQGRPMKCSNEFGESILHLACRKGLVEVARFLIQEAKVPVQVCDDYGRNPLHDAAWVHTPNFELIDMILAQSPDLLYIQDRRGHTPLSFARRDQWKSWNAYLKSKSKEFLTPKVIPTLVDKDTELTERRPSAVIASKGIRLPSTGVIASKGIKITVQEVKAKAEPIKDNQVKKPEPAVAVKKSPVGATAVKKVASPPLSSSRVTATAIAPAPPTTTVPATTTTTTTAPSCAPKTQAALAKPPAQVRPSPLQLQHYVHRPVNVAAAAAAPTTTLTWASAAPFSTGSVPLLATQFRMPAPAPPVAAPSPSAASLGLTALLQASQAHHQQLQAQQQAQLRHPGAPLANLAPRPAVKSETSSVPNNASNSIVG